MLALNQTTIDYFSLDVEGHEREVLDTIPWEKINIKAMTIEYPDLLQPWAAIEELKAYMKNRSYTAHQRFNEVIPENYLVNRDIFLVKDKK